MMAKKNLTLLRIVRNHILQVPESYNQRTYGKASSRAPCGGAFCIAGNTLILGGLAKPREVIRGVRDDGTPINFDDEAGRALGLTQVEAMRVFAASPETYWPQPFASQYQVAECKVERARVAANYINFIIRTGKVTG